MQAENAGSAENPVVKIVLLSNNVDYWRRPSAEEEVQQRLTLAISGKASLSRYRWGNGTRHELTATRRLQFPPEQVSRLISEVYDAVVLRDSAIVACDIGCWIMTIHYENGESGSYWGSLIPDATRRLVILSETIRELLDCPDLFVFDGQARTDTLERLVLDYHRRTRSQPDVPPGHAPEIVTRDYAERLQIDRQRQTIRLSRRAGAEGTIRSEYHIPHRVSELLDRLELTGFDRASCTADDAIIDPDDVREFRLVLRYRKAGRKVFSGYYDRDGLPLGWADFAETLLSFLSSYGDAESLSPDTYTRRRRRQGDLMFLSVVFGEKGQEYCYLSPDETIEVGDWVHVPVGEENHVATAKIAAVIWLPKEEAPIPFEMIKTAIGKADD